MNAFTLIGFKCMLSNVCQSNMSSKPWIIIWLSQLPIYAGFQSFWRILLGVLPEGMQLWYQWLWRPLCQRSLKLLWRWRLRPHQGRPKRWPSKGSAPSADHPSTASRAAGVEKNCFVKQCVIAGAIIYLREAVCHFWHVSDLTLVSFCHHK